MANMQVVPKIEQYELKEFISINSELGELQVEVVVTGKLNTKNGQIEIANKMKTSHFSTNDEAREGLYERIALMKEQMYLTLQARKLELSNSNQGPNLFNQNQGEE
jgi:hypothetical protein